MSNTVSFLQTPSVHHAATVSLVLGGLAALAGAILLSYAISLAGAVLLGLGLMMVLLGVLQRCLVSRMDGVGGSATSERSEIEGFNHSNPELGSEDKTLPSPPGLPENLRINNPIRALREDASSRKPDEMEMPPELSAYLNGSNARPASFQGSRWSSTLSQSSEMEWLRWLADQNRIDSDPGARQFFEFLNKPENADLAERVADAIVELHSTPQGWDLQQFKALLNVSGLPQTIKHVAEIYYEAAEKAQEAATAAQECDRKKLELKNQLLELEQVKQEIEDSKRKYEIRVKEQEEKDQLHRAFADIALKSTCVTTLLPIDVSIYGNLRKKIQQYVSLDVLHITDETGKHEEKMLWRLGEGGSKIAVEIEKGRALILPNMDVDSTKEIAYRWERMVLEEVEMSKILTKIGLLSPRSKQVAITLEESSKEIIPAYVSETFESFRLKGCFIIDTKNASSSTWELRKDFLFQSDEERLVEENWDLVFNAALDDLVKIFLHRIPTSIDSFNLAIVKKESEKSNCQYEARYFGFDFSSKNGKMNIPDVENIISSYARLPIHEVVQRFQPKDLIEDLVGIVFSYEFCSLFKKSETDNRTAVCELKSRLIEKYSEQSRERLRDVLAVLKSEEKLPADQGSVLDSNSFLSHK